MQSRAHLTESTAGPDQIIALVQPELLAVPRPAPVTVGAGGPGPPAGHGQPVTGEGGGAPGHAPRPPVTLGLGPEADPQMGRRLDARPRAVQDAAQAGLNTSNVTLVTIRVSLMSHLCCHAVTRGTPDKSASSSGIVNIDDWRVASSSR